MNTKDITISHKDIGTRIRTLREYNNYTREVFSEKIGISSKFLYEIEYGKKGFSADTLLKISHSLSVSCDYLLTGRDVNNQTAERITGMLEGFDPRQLGHVKDILDLIRKMMYHNT